MCKRKRTGWLLVGICALSLGLASAQEEGPILLPKPKPVPKPASPTLLVMCDLACNWKLDGEAIGRIEAGGSAKTKVELGQHIVIAVTVDGLDQVQQLVKVKEKGQTVIANELQPIRDVRLRKEQDARDKAEQQARDKAEQMERDNAIQAERDKAVRERVEKEQKQRESTAHDEAAGIIWTDVTTGLTWTKKDNGSNVNWRQAAYYCRNLQLSGHSDWRLPEIDELTGIYDGSKKVQGLLNNHRATYHVMGDLQLTGWEWSNTQGNVSGEAWEFLFQWSFGPGYKQSHRLGDNYITRGLCVRRSQD
jgi:hypothetical protein